MTDLTKEWLDELARTYDERKTMRGVSAAKRVHVCEGFLDDWWVGYGKDASCQIEGTPNHWRWLAMILLGLADQADAPYDEDKETPEVVPTLIAMAKRTEAAERRATDMERLSRYETNFRETAERERDALAEHVEHCFKQHDCWPSADVVRILNRMRGAALAQPTTDAGGA